MGQMMATNFRVESDIDGDISGNGIFEYYSGNIIIFFEGAFEFPFRHFRSLELRCTVTFNSFTVATVSFEI